MSEETPDLETEDGAAEPEAGGDDSAPKGKPDQSQALLRKLKKAEKELEALRQAEEQRTQGTLSEVEKLKQQLQKRDADYSSLTEKLRMQSIEHRFEQAAAKAGVIDADAARRLADFSSVDIDEDGTVSGIDAVIADLKKTRKYLFGPTTTPVGNAGGNPASGPPSKITDEMVRSMSSVEFAEYLRKQQSR